MKARNEEACYLGPAWFSFPFFVLSKCLTECSGMIFFSFQRSIGTGMRRRCSHRQIANFGADLVVIPGAIRDGQICTRPLCLGVRSLVDSQGKGNVRCAATCGVPAPGERKTCLIGLYLFSDFSSAFYCC